jgi:hypothetical protein
MRSSGLAYLILKISSKSEKSWLRGRSSEKGAPATPNTPDRISGVTDMNVPPMMPPQLLPSVLQHNSNIELAREIVTHTREREREHTVASQSWVDGGFSIESHSRVLEERRDHQACEHHEVEHSLLAAIGNNRKVRVVQCGHVHQRRHIEFIETPPIGSTQYVSIFIRHLLVSLPTDRPTPSDQATEREREG